MSIRKVLIIGGSGFVGTAVAARLARDGIALLIPTRRRDRVRHLLSLPTVELVEADVFEPATLERLMTGVDAVVSLVGVLHSRSGTPYGADFARAHVDLPTRIVAAARKVGVTRIVHISALGADASGPSEYQRSKAAGEAAIRAASTDVGWTILRPSVIFGAGDSFLNLFAGLLKTFPLLPLGGAGARFQPVYVEDVANIVAEALTRPDALGQTYDVAGPRQYTLKELVKYVGEVTGHPRPVIPLPEGLAMLQARVLECLPGPLMSRDNVRSMRADNVASGPAQPWGRQPTSLETIAPAYLGSANKRGRFDSYQLRRP
ncbi:MAG: complex I NDUFA9 subunit family protein [Zoogloea sp.]|nr:complex I NDUFA9 subunit family protein [Zoogloea sp.]